MNISNPDETVFHKLADNPGIISWYTMPQLTALLPTTTPPTNFNVEKYLSNAEFSTFSIVSSHLYSMI